MQSTKVKWPSNTVNKSISWQSLLKMRITMRRTNGKQLWDLLAESAAGPGWGMTATSVPEMAEGTAENSEIDSSPANQVKCAVTKGCPTSSVAGGWKKSFEVTEEGRSKALVRCMPWELGECPGTIFIYIYTFLILMTSTNHVSSPRGSGSKSFQWKEIRLLICLSWGV